MRPRINRYRTKLNNNSPPTRTSTGTQKCTSVSTLFSQLRRSLFFEFLRLGVTVIDGAIIAHASLYNTSQLIIPPQFPGFALAARPRYSP
jgi:hypothetical protein